MRFVCESCRAQYMINDDKVGPKGVKVRCRKCGYVITVRRADATGTVAVAAPPPNGHESPAQGQSTGDAIDALEGAGAEQAPASPAGDGPAAPGPRKDTFLGADEDEIGAVFDQVLATGTQPAIREAVPSGGPGDDAESSRALDEALGETAPREAADGGGEGAEPVPETNWFVAIDEKQTGPLTLEKVKEHWDRGEVGPDSLCWREGFADWIPLASVKSLAAVLAPKPARPIVVPAATFPASTVVTVPVQSAFSAGGLVQTVQSEVQVPLPAPAGEEGAWKPGAASALASLVKDELDALARPSRPAPPPPPAAAAEAPRPVAGLLDLPEEKPAPRPPPSAPHPAAPERASARGATNPYLATPNASYPPAAPPPERSSSNRGLVIGLSAVGGVVVLVMFGLIAWLAARPAVVVAPPAAVAPPPAPVAVAPPAPTPAPVPTPAAAAPAATAAAAIPAPTPAPPPATAAAAQPPAPTAAAAPAVPTHVPAPRPAKVATAKVDRPEPVARPEPAKAPEAGADEFDRAFGGPAKVAKREEPKPEPAPRRDVYVPPAPGGGADVKDSLGQSDIIEVVVANTASFRRCAEEQHQKEPGTSGRLVMRWQILTTGKVTNVAVVSEEFKNTAMAGCVTKLIKSLTFPRHRQQGEPVTFPFKF